MQRVRAVENRRVKVLTIGRFAAKSLKVRFYLPDLFYFFDLVISMHDAKLISDVEE